MEEHSQIERLVLEELSADLELPALPAPPPAQADSAPEDTAPPAETAETAPEPLPDEAVTRHTTTLWKYRRRSRSRSRSI